MYWQIEPYHTNDADYWVGPAETEADHRAALEYAQERLEAALDQLQPGMLASVTIELCQGDQPLPVRSNVGLGCSIPDWVIEINAIGGPCYLNETIDGDPGRTHDISRAERYATENEARESMNAVRRKYPNREYKARPLAEMPNA